MDTKQQVQGFVFNGDNGLEAKKIIARYPEGRQASAVLPLLDLAQRQNGGWLSQAAMEHVAKLLKMAKIRVLEVATFYTMYRLNPVGKFVVQVCTTTPCALRGCREVLNACKEELEIEVGGTTSDNKFTLFEVECLGACVNAPMIQINDDYFEDLDPKKLEKIIDQINKNESPKPGSYRGRLNSEPENIRKTLLGNNNA